MGVWEEGMGVWEYGSMGVWEYGSGVFNYHIPILPYLFQCIRSPRTSIFFIRPAS
jgi:hypothetical protein